MKRIKGKGFTSKVMRDILDAQEIYITKEFGKDYALHANWGWFTDEPNGQITTKIYTHPKVYSITSEKHSDGHIEHEINYH